VKHVALSATLAIFGCPAEDVAETEAVVGAPEWRVAPNPGAIAQEVATLRGQPLALQPSVAVGTLPGQPAVGPRGAASWTMQLDVAPGVAGMTPEIAIQYDSSDGNGPLGVGFSLAATSTIRRCAMNLLDDGATMGPTWTNSDALCLGGDRLILEAGTYGDDGATYRLAHDPTVRIEQNLAMSSASSSFDVYHGNGHVLTHGTAGGTLWRGPNPTTGQPYVWSLVQRRDRFNNTIDYAYDVPLQLPTGPTELRFRSIRYGGTGVPASRREVSFDYEARSDVTEVKSRFLCEGTEGDECGLSVQAARWLV
jgi:hypothetical protein